NIYDPQVNPVQVRRRIGMVFQRPTVFPSSIYENVAFGLRLERESREVVDRGVVRSLKRAGLWEEVREDLDRPALALSGGQQQRLCIARALAVEPGVLLMDEPTSSLDPIATQKVEDMIYELKKEYTVIIVTHNMQQAARVADYTAFLYQGHLVEFEETRQLFESPREKLTENYITGRFG
ncbi:phosphate ABC transporter, ATPase subunit, partial [mine drainage metagenome]